MRPEPVIVGLLFTFAATAATNPSAVTFTKDVAPVLQKNCQGCHRSGEAAPFSLLTYEQARPWAKAMKEAVLLKKMPPWFADPHYGKFSNDRSLAQKEIDTLVAWADACAPLGDPKDTPPPASFVEGWRIPKPDVVFEMPNAFEVPAAGTIEYQYIVVPTGFTEDKWVRFSEARPENRQLVHHIIAFIREPDSKWLKDAKPGVPFVPKKNKDGEKDEGGRAGDFLAGYAPGTMPVELAPGQAKLVKAGSDLVLQMHYTANGKATSDISRSTQATTRAISFEDGCPSSPPKLRPSKHLLNGGGDPYPYRPCAVAIVLMTSPTESSAHAAAPTKARLQSSATPRRESIATRPIPASTWPSHRSSRRSSPTWATTRSTSFAGHSSPAWPASWSCTSPG